MMTPQLTEQYGHVDRVSVVRAIFSSRIAAYAGARSKPSTEAATPPRVLTFRNSLRVGCTMPPESGETASIVGPPASGKNAHGRAAGRTLATNSRWRIIYADSSDPAASFLIRPRDWTRQRMAKARPHSGIARL